MASRDIKHLHRKLQPIAEEFLKRCQEAGIDIIITCTYRPPDEQAALYAQGRTSPGKIVTNAKAGQSKHNWAEDGCKASKAFDIAVIANGKACWQTNHPAWQIAGKIGEELGLNWYGKPSAPFREYPHFELKEDA